MTEVTLKELFEKQFENIDRRLNELKAAIEKLAEGTIREDRFTSTVHKVEELQTLVKQLDDRVDETESQIRIYKYIGSVVVGIVAVVVAALVKSWLGL